MTLASRAVVEQVARLPFLAGDGGSRPTPRLHFQTGTVDEVNALLGAGHYLGPVRGLRYGFTGWVDDLLVTCAAWRQPTARMLPSDGSWLELSRWCLTSGAGDNAGSRMMGWMVRWLRREAPQVTTLVSYSDPSVGHVGTLYKACGWAWEPTWHRLSPPPTGNGSWDGVHKSEVKDRWILRLGGEDDA